MKLKHVLRSPEGDEGAAAPAAASTAELEALQKQNAELQRETEAMRAKMQELLDEAKRAKETKREAEAEAQRAAEEKARKEGDFEQLLKSSESEREALKGELEALRQSIKTEKVQAEAMKMAAGLTKDTAKAELLAEKIAQRLSLSEDGIKVLDEAGQLTVSPVEDLKNQIIERYAFLIDGSQASGGGATGANGSAVKMKAFNEYSGAELAEIRRNDPTAYDRLKAAYHGT